MCEYSYQTINSGSELPELISDAFQGYESAARDSYGRTPDRISLAEMCFPDLKEHFPSAQEMKSASVHELLDSASVHDLAKACVLVRRRGSPIAESKYS